MGKKSHSSKNNALEWSTPQCQPPLTLADKTYGSQGRGGGWRSMTGMLLVTLVMMSVLTMLSVLPTLTTTYLDNSSSEVPGEKNKSPVSRPTVVSPVVTTTYLDNSSSEVPGEKNKSPVSRPTVPTETQPPAPKSTPKLKPAASSTQVDIHFVHIPKTGGTSLNAVLRQIACHLDPARNADCCLNPGFCDNAHRRCAAIKGCTNHLPNRKWIFEPPPSITMMREPVSRLISAFFYRGHSPNIDSFGVRPEFKLIKLGKAPRVEFPEYIEMVEYQNIQTRMLGAGSFPYRNVTITDEIFAKAQEAVEGFFFVGVQEAYELSVELLQRELKVGELDIPIENERDNNSKPKTKMDKDRIRSDTKLIARTLEVNDWDVRLYDMGVRRFCNALAKYPDLLDKLDTTKVKCPDEST